MTTLTEKQMVLAAEIKDRLVHFYGKTDGSFQFPNSCDGDALKLVARMLGLLPEDPAKDPKTFTVNVTVFVKPFGVRLEQTTNLFVEVEELYREMQKAAHFLTAEVVGDMVHLCVENGTEDVDMELVPNGPDVQSALETMLKRKMWTKRREIYGE